MTLTYTGGVDFSRFPEIKNCGVPRSVMDAAIGACVTHFGSVNSDGGNREVEQALVGFNREPSRIRENWGETMVLHGDHDLFTDDWPGIIYPFR